MWQRVTPVASCYHTHRDNIRQHLANVSTSIYFNTCTILTDSSGQTPRLGGDVQPLQPLLGGVTKCHSTADRGGYNLSTYALAILVHIYNSLINMGCLHILPHI